MKTIPSIPTALSCPSQLPSPEPSPADWPRAGRPSSRNAQMIDGLCAIIRETGASDSGAASRMGLHPSTVSRWKKEAPDLAILFRAAREQFRLVHLEIIFSTARAGAASSWRAAAWVLERIFPQDYAPRAAERAKFQEMHEAACADEGEGSELEPLGDCAKSSAVHRGEAWQNVQKLPVAAPPVPDVTLADAMDGALDGLPLPGKPLPNVKNPVLAGPLMPAVAEKGRKEW